MKLQDITQNRVIPLSNVHNDLFVRDIPASEFDVLFKDAQNLGDDEAATQKFIEVIFTQLLCDKDGNILEDMEDKEYSEICKIIPASLMWELVAEVPKAILPKTEALGN